MGSNRFCDKTRKSNLSKFFGFEEFEYKVSSITRLAYTVGIDLRIAKSPLLGVQ